MQLETIFTIFIFHCMCQHNSGVSKTIVCTFSKKSAVARFVREGKDRI